MISVKKTLISLGLITGWLLICSWGFLVHKTVQQLAIYELPKTIRPFFYQHREKLVYDAPRPDMRRNQDSTEATKHFIDLEMFGKDAIHEMPLGWDDAVKKYTQDSLLKYGYVPYHVIYIKGKLTDAFRSQNKDSILFYASDLGHYISDAHVPLHTTVNYDGQLTNQKGIHSLWESMIPELEIAHYNLYSKHQATYLKHPEQSIWNAVKTAADLVPEMLAKEKELSTTFTDAQKYRVQIRRGKEVKSYTSEFAKAYAASLKNSINDQLLASANLIADFYYTAWVDAGKPNLDDLHKGFNHAEKKAMKKEIKQFRNNELLSTNQLLAKKAATKEEF